MCSNWWRASCAPIGGEPRANTAFCCLVQLNTKQNTEVQGYPATYFRFEMYTAEFAGNGDKVMLACCRLAGMQANMLTQQNFVDHKSFCIFFFLIALKCTKMEIARPWCRSPLQWLFPDIFHFCNCKNLLIFSFLNFSLNIGCGDDHEDAKPPYRPIFID